MAQKNRIPFVSLLAISAAMPAFAQEGPQTEPAADNGRDVVIITANKRQESIQDVAVAVTAVTSEQKQEYGIITLTDLTNVTPGLAYTPADERVTLRGIGRLTNSIGADPGVANYNDGFYTSFATTAGKDALFVERVEVLRGPQGTLYGRNAIGGAINVISKRPTDEFSGDVKLSGGNYNYRNAAATVSGPITDWLRYRVAGQREMRDGVDYNYGTGEYEGWAIDQYRTELQLEGDIGDRFNWWFKAADSGFDQAGPPGGSTSTFGTDPYLKDRRNLDGSPSIQNAWAYTTDPSIISFTQAGTRQDSPFATNGEHAYNSNRAGVGTLDQADEYTLEAVYSTDWFDIKYVGGYNYFNYHRTFDNDGTPIKSITYNAITSQITAGPCAATAPGGVPLLGLPTSVLAGPAAGCISGFAPRTIFPNTSNTYGESRAFFSNEINLISTTEGPLQWLAGAYQYQDNNNQPGRVLNMFDEPLVDSYYNAPFITTNSTAPTNVANPDRTIQKFANKSLFNAYGLYGQLDYSLNDQLKFTVGLRYSKDVKTSEEEAFATCYILCVGVGIPQSNFANITHIAFGSALTATEAVDGYTAHIDERGYLVRHLHGSWDAVTGTAGVEYRPMDDTLTYLKYSRGYKAGGFNNLVFPRNPYTNSEFVDAYEAGWKQTWDSLNLTTNAAAFFYNYTDAQAPLAEIQDVGGVKTTTTRFVNLPEVQTTGFELESNWNPIDDLNIGFTYAFLNAEITESGVYTDPTRDVRCDSDPSPSVVTPVPCTVTITELVDPLSSRSVKGNTLTQTPKHRVALNASYLFTMEDGSSWLPTVSYTWRDEFFSSFFNNESQKSPAYDNIDARLNWKSADGVLGMTFWVRNLANTDQTASVDAQSFRTDDNRTWQFYNYTLPRTYGVDLLVHF